MPHITSSHNNQKGFPALSENAYLLLIPRFCRSLKSKNISPTPFLQETVKEKSPLTAFLVVQGQLFQIIRFLPKDPSDSLHSHSSHLLFQILSILNFHTNNYIQTFLSKQVLNKHPFNSSLQPPHILFFLKRKKKMSLFFEKMNRCYIR